MRFTFQDQDWKDVIPWFADQAGYTLQPVDDWPEGMFSLQDDQPYTVLEALDQLNHALRIRKPEAYTLIRNRKMLVLARVGDANFPDELIETVPVDQLDSRGFYEVIECRFDLGDLSAEAMFGELRPMISDSNSRQYAVFPASNQLFVRETGEQLRNIRDLIEAAQMKADGEKRELTIYQLKHQDAETFLAIAGPQLGMPAGTTVNADQTLSITSEPLGNRLFVSGTRKMLTRFAEISVKIDSAPDQGGSDVELARPYLKTYPVLVDPKLAFDLLQTMLEGTDARMQQDESSGAITVLGHEEEHLRVAESLAVISAKTGDDFAIIKLEKIEAADALTILQNVFRQTTSTTEDGASGPVLLADSYLSQIMVSGTVQEVATVRKIIEEVDKNYEPLASGPRTPVRIIPMDQQDQDRLVPMLNDLLGTTGRSNRFKVILPEDRPALKDRIRRGDLDDPNAVPSTGEILPGISQPSRPNDGARGDSAPDRANGGVSQTMNSASEWLFVASAVLGIDAPAVGLLWQDDEKPATKSTDYVPPQQMQSVPGAPIEFRFNEFGVTIESLDLDAADDIEDAIREFVGEQGTVQLPSFFYLKHRPATEIQQMLEQFYGIGDSGGGGGGGAGLMGGMMNNMMGGAGDLLGGLLDTGSDSTASAELEGEVAIGLDVRFNAIWIRGATGNDLSEISELIDMWDRPEGPTQPELPGTFRTIDIIHRKAIDLVEIIKKQIPDLIFNPEAQQSQGGNNNEMQQMMRAMQQLTGGQKKGGGNAADVEKMKPKATLGVDEVTNQLLVTGPDFIYQEIYDIVAKLDTPDLSVPLNAEVIPEITGSKRLLFETLKGMYGDKVVIANEAVADPNSRTPAGATPTGASPAADAAQKQQDAVRSAIMNSMRMQQGGGRGGAPGGGGRGGGGGGGRGGGRGGGAPGGGAPAGIIFGGGGGGGRGG